MRPSLFAYLFVLNFVLASLTWSEEKKNYPHTDPNKADLERYAEDQNEDLACSAISLIVPGVSQSMDRVPQTIGEWVNRLKKHGPFVAATATFSRAPAPTSLAFPRHLMTVDFANYTKESPFSLRGKLFLAAVKNASGGFDLEFISWNASTRRNDFGVIQNFNQPDKRRLISNAKMRQDCTVCHKGGSAIFAPDPWPEFIRGGDLSLATVSELAKTDKRFEPLKEAIGKLMQKVGNDPALFRQIVDPQDLRAKGPLKDDKKIELGEGELKAIKTIRSATFWTDGSDTHIPMFVDQLPLFSDLVTPNQGLALSNEIAIRLGHERSLQFGEAFAGHRIAQSGLTLASANIDFGEELFAPFLPFTKEREAMLKRLAESLTADERKKIVFSSHSSDIKGLEPVHAFNSDEVGKRPERTMAEIIAFDEKRRSGLTVVPQGFRVSDPTTFLHEAITLEKILQTEQGVPGLSADDIRLLNALLYPATGVKAEGELPKQEKHTLIKATEMQATLIKSAVASPEVKKLFVHGYPAPDELMTVLLPALSDEIKKRGLPLAAVEGPRAGNCYPPKQETMPNGVNAFAKTDADQDKKVCAGCHLGHNKTGIVKFSFDPEDRAAWKTFLVDPKTKQQTGRRLKLVIQRLQDADMPPQDSLERDLLKHEKSSGGRLKDLLQYLLDLEAGKI